MKVSVAILIVLMTAAMARAQTNEPALDVDVGGMLDAAQQFAQENLDDDVLQALGEVDRDQVENFLNRYEEFLQGDYVLDLTQLKGAANTALPLLEAHEETQPYAAWLRARLDYFDVAEELKTNAPSPQPVPGTNSPPVQINPSFAAEQEIWIKKVSPRPWPKGAEKFVPKLKSIFTAERVPDELVWLAEVESGFDTRARSPAGALGMFQIMPATAKDLGLSLWPLDQRKQVEPSARAAAKYLRQLHQQFGDWRLAVAAYNCGPGTVQRVLRRYKTKNYAGIATRLPAETQLYVPKVEATIQKREGRALQKLNVD